MLRWLERSLTYCPDSAVHANLDRFSLDRRVIDLSHEQTVDVRFKRASSPFVILFSHGNRANLTFYSWFYELFERLGCSYVTYDYPGYGASRGIPSEASIYEAVDAVYDISLREFAVSGASIVHFGLSLGGTAAIELSTHKPCAGLILEATLSCTHDIGRMVMRGLPLYRLLPNRFRSIEKVGRISAPKLFIHGTKDPTIPYLCSRKLYEASPEPRFFLTVDGAAHNDVGIVGGAQYYEALQEFLSSLPIP